MSTLEKSLGPVSGTAMMLNTVLGVGILTLPGLAAAQSGVDSIWTWVLCALANVPLLAVFALLASRFPEAGGVAHIAGRAFGRPAALVASFLFLGAVFLGLPSIALTGGNYLEAATGISATQSAAALVIAASLANLAIPRLAARIGSIAAGFVILFLIGLVAMSFLLVMGGGAGGAATAAILAQPFSPALAFAPFMLVFFAFTGWEVALSTTGEFKNPKRDVPLAVAISFVVAVGFYVVCAITVVAAGPSAYTAAPFAAILAPALGPAAGLLIAFGVVMLIAANLFAAFWAVSRMVLSVAREGALPKFLDTTRAGVPVAAILVNCGIFLMVIVADWEGIVDIDGLIAKAGQNFFIIYGMSALALVRLGRTLTEKAFGLVSLAIVAAIAAYAGEHLFYPLMLIAAALAVHRWTSVPLVTTVAAK